MTDSRSSKPNSNGGSGAGRDRFATDEERFAPTDFGNRFSRFESEPGAPQQPEERPANPNEAPRTTPAPSKSHSSSHSNSGSYSGPATRDGFLDFWKSLFFFEGRATRGRFWAVYVIGALLLSAQIAALLIIESGTGGEDAAGAEPLGLLENSAGLLTIFFGLIYAWVHAVTTVRRYHDRDKPGVWMILLFVPLGYLAVLLECGFAEGTPGPNRYGPDPRGNGTPG